MLYAISYNDQYYSEFYKMIANVYSHFIGLLIIFSVISLLVTIFFLMYTRNDKQITTLKSAAKKILITVTAVLCMGSLYIWLMNMAVNGKWNENDEISHPPVSASSQAAK